jgi:hypothetical protein
MLSGQDRFVAKYNVGLAMRMHGQLETAHSEFNDALISVKSKNVS